MRAPPERERAGKPRILVLRRKTRKVVLATQGGVSGSAFTILTGPVFISRTSAYLTPCSQITFYSSFLYPNLFGLDSWIVHSLPLGAPLQAAGEEGQDPVLLQAAQLCARGLQADHEGARRRQGRRAEEDEDSEGRATGM